MPFAGDQAIFTVHARQLTRGAVLYRDIFEFRQPGIFIFYAVSGQLFGFTEVGIHLFELIYWLVFSIFAIVALRPYFAARWAVSLVPIFTVVASYWSRGGIRSHPDRNPRRLPDSRRVVANRSSRPGDPRRTTPLRCCGPRDGGRRAAEVSLSSNRPGLPRVRGAPRPPAACRDCRRRTLRGGVRHHAYRPAARRDRLLRRARAARTDLVDVFRVRPELTTDGKQIRSAISSSARGIS